MTVELHSDDAGLDGNAALVAEFLADLVERWSLKLPLLTLGSYIVRKAEKRETDRVDAIRARDRADAEEEEARRAAQLEMSNGVTVNVHDTVVPPTPEWLAKTSHRIVHVGADDWTDRSAHEPVRTVRRVLTSFPERMFLDGRLVERQLKACIWYQDQYEYSGFTGTVRTASLEPRIPTGNRGQLPFSQSQLDAQDEYNSARLMIPLRLRTFFEAIVLFDKSISKASVDHYAGRYPIDSFRCCADRVADYIQYAPGRSE